jgi:hypothetical protein
MLLAQSPARPVLHPAEWALDLAPAKDPDASDHKDVWVAHQVFHPDATVRFPVLDSLLFASFLFTGR